MKAMVAVIFVALAGCALPVQRPLTHQEMRDRVVASRDDFKKLYEYTGPDVGGPGASIFLRAWRLDERPDELKSQLYLSHRYGGSWHFYSEAWSSTGRRMSLTKIDAHVVGCYRYSGCEFREDVGINLDQADLDDAAQNGLKVKLSGRGGEQIFWVQPSYFSAFRNATAKGD